MIDVLLYTDPAQDCIGFRVKGHAGYAQYGQDIVCSAVSVLVINTINSVEKFTEDVFDSAVHEEEDVVSFEITSRPVSPSSKLLLNSLALGLQGIESEYGKKHVKVHFKKKQEG